jgi:hypothetical protein
MWVCGDVVGGLTNAALRCLNTANIEVKALRRRSQPTEGKYE